MRITKRKYKMSDASLIQTSDNILGSANRDLAELAAYGVDAAKLTAIEALRDTFSNTPTDEEFMGDMMIATDARNLKAEAVRNTIRPIAARFAVKFGEQSGQYRALRADNLSQQRNDELVRTARAVSRRATLHLADLASEGLTAAIITDLDSKIQLHDDAIDAQIDAVKNRDIAVDGRIKNGNELYNALIKLAEYGKAAWFNVNEAKYNDYIVNESSKKAAQVLTGSVNMNQSVNLSVSDVGDDTVITVTAEGASVVVYFAENPADGPNAFQQTVAAGTSRTFIASDIGFASGTRERLNLYGMGPGAVNYEVVVEV